MRALNKVESWIAAVPHDSGDAVMLAVHERLRDSQRLAKNQGFVFVGALNRDNHL